MPLGRILHLCRMITRTVHGCSKLIWPYQQDLTGTDDAEPTDSKASFKDPSWGDDGEEDDEDMAEFLREKEDEEQKIERKRAKNK